MHAKNGQAMIEFAICLFAFALVLSALLAFGQIIPRSAQLISEARRAAGCAAQNGRGLPTDAIPTQIANSLPEGIRQISAIESVTEERHETADVGSLAAEYFFKTNGDNEYRIREKATMPSMKIPNVRITYGGEQ